MTSSDEAKLAAALAPLAARLRLPPEAAEPARLLVALATYFSLSVKLLLWRSDPAAAFPLDPPADDPGVLHRQLAACEAASPAIARTLDGSPPADPFAWYLDAWSEPIASWIAAAGETLSRLASIPSGRVTRPHARDPRGTSHSRIALDPPERDWLRPLYEALFPRRLRHAQGEYFTPAWLAEHLLDETGYAGDPAASLLDPTCGSGVFLAAAIRRIVADRPAELADPRAASRLAREILAAVAGCDLNPLAVLAARFNCLMALGPLGRYVAARDIPVFQGDAVLDDARATVGGPFDFVVGNPPWIAWDNLPGEYRRGTAGLWRQYGLFSLSARAARHGGGKKDLAMLVLYASADRYLRCGGRLGLLVPQTLFQSRGAGDGFRRFRLGSDGPHLRVVRAGDMVRLRPFPGAANWTGLVVLEKGRPTRYPVPYARWSPDRREDLLAAPVDPSRPTSPWLLLPEELATLVRDLVGPSHYRAYLGANSGGANGVYWLKVLGGKGGLVRVRNLAGRGSRALESMEAAIEAELIYPLLRWCDISPFRAVPRAHLLLVQDVQRRAGLSMDCMVRHYPATLAYLRRFEPELLARAAFQRYQGRHPFYSMYNVGPYTLADFKVVWRRMDRRIRAAAVGPVEEGAVGRRPIVPQETCVFIPTASAAEAHYLAALLNSALIGLLATAHNVYGGKGFGSPGMLEYLGLPRFDPADPRHAELADLGRAAHVAAAVGRPLGDLTSRLDGAAARLRGLSPRHFEGLRRYGETVGG